jgi:hypothetical protein
VRGSWPLLRVQGGRKLWCDLRDMQRGDAEMQGPREYVAVRGMPIGFGLQRRYAKLQHDYECLRTAAFVRRIGVDLRSEREQRLLRVKRGDGGDDGIVLSELRRGHGWLHEPGVSRTSVLSPLRVISKITFVPFHSCLSATKPR